MNKCEVTVLQRGDRGIWVVLQRIRKACRRLFWSACRVRSTTRQMEGQPWWSEHGATLQIGENPKYVRVPN